jgi:HK97 family phage major capsid protein
VEKCRELGIKLQLAETLDRRKGFIKASGESINAAGGFLAPNELEREILSLRDLAGVYRSNARNITLGSDSRSFPRRVTGTTASWTAEGAAVTASQASFDEIRFNAKKLASLVLVSSELYEDETAGFAAWIAEEMAWGFADQEDNAAFNGDGTSTYVGIRGMTQLAIDGSHTAGKYTASANSYGALTAADLAGFLGLVPNYAIGNAAIYVSHAGFANTLWRLAQASGALTSQTINGEVTWFYLGVPIRLTPKLPSSTGSLSGKVMMIAGDLKLGAAIGTRRGVTIRRSEDRYLDTDQIGVIGTERVDIANFGLGDNSAAGPIVSLVGA